MVSSGSQIDVSFTKEPPPPMRSVRIERCGAQDADCPEFVCERPAGHEHQHEHGAHAWPQVRPTPRREQLEQVRRDAERYLDDDWDNWESPSDES